MNDKEQIIRNAAYVWEVGLLRFLYNKGLLTAEEYEGILKIARQQTDAKIYML